MPVQSQARRLHITLALTLLKLKPIANLAPKGKRSSSRRPTAAAAAPAGHHGSALVEKGRGGAVARVVRVCAALVIRVAPHDGGTVRDALVGAPPEGNAKEAIRRRRRVTTTVSSNDAAVATGSLPAA